jgi:ABC-type phosphate transport system substrate-binding protein
MKKISLQAVVLTFALVGALPCSAQVAVVAGAKSAATPLSADQAAGLFLGKSDQLPGAGVALLLDQPESNPNRELFYTKVAGKSAAQVKAAWSRLVFSGKGTPPKEIANSAEVKKLVSSNPNAVGYIEKSAVDSSVKVLFAAD